jgi:DNA-binding transcriptional LysR family regulator
MAEGLKAMAMEGHGLAFLPQSAAKKELKAKKLVRADYPSSAQWEVAMDVRAYREKPQSSDAVKTGAQALWDYLVSRNAAHNP